MTTTLSKDDAIALACHWSAIEKREEHVLALVQAIEDDLATRCGDGGLIPNDAPLQAWHLCRILLGIVSGTAEHQDFGRSLAPHLPEPVRTAVSG